MIVSPQPDGESGLPPLEWTIFKYLMSLSSLVSY